MTIERGHARNDAFLTLSVRNDAFQAFDGTVLASLVPRGSGEVRP